MRSFVSIFVWLAPSLKPIFFKTKTETKKKNNNKNHFRGRNFFWLIEKYLSF